MLAENAVPAGEGPVNESPAVDATAVEAVHLYEVEFDQKKFYQNLEQVRVQYNFCDPVSHHGFFDLVAAIKTYPDVIFCKHGNYVILHFKGQNLERNDLLLLTSILS